MRRFFYLEISKFIPTFVKNFLIHLVISNFGGLNASSSYVAKLGLNTTNDCT
jgi:hypothetical protein